jgi:hypothetical protein
MALGEEEKKTKTNFTAETQRRGERTEYKQKQRKI